MALLDDERELRSVGSTDRLGLEVCVGESTNKAEHRAVEGEHLVSFGDE